MSARIPILLLLLLALAPLALAQNERLILQVDDESAAQLKRLDQLGQKGEWDRVVTGLDELLKNGGGILLPGDPPVTARAEARKRLLALPAEGKQVYDDLHAIPARQLLEEGLTHADPGPLETILALHPATESAEPARRALVEVYAERGQSGAALVHLEALAPSKDPVEQDRLARLRALLLALAGRDGEAREALDRVQSEARAELRARIDQLQPAAPAAPPGEARVAWKRPVIDFWRKKDARGREGEPRNWTVPRADGGVLFLHDGSHASALELASGKVRWRTSLRPGADAFLSPPGGSACRTLLAAGRVLCCLPAEQGLAVLDRRTGQVVWRRSLSELKNEAGLELEAGFGPTGREAQVEVVGDVAVLPLVTTNQDREVHLIGVDLETGRAVWRVFACAQTGGQVPKPVVAVGLERSYLVTGLGVVLAVDTRGELVWLRKYRSLRDKNRRAERAMNPWGGVVDEEARGPPERDPSALVHRGLLWCLPADSETLVALDARTGDLRGELAAGEKARIVGARGAGVITLAEGGQLQLIERSGPQPITRVQGLLSRVRVQVEGELALLPTTRGIAQVALDGGDTFPFADWSAVGGEGNLLLAGGRLVIAADNGVTALGAAVADDVAPEAPPLAGLASASFERRQAAQAALMDQGEAARAELTSAAADHADPEVRLRARQLLGELDRAVFVARWRPLIKPEWLEKVDELLIQLTHPNAEVRLEVLARLGQIEGDPDVLTLFKDLLQDPDPRVQQVAATGLLRRKDRSGVPLLYGLLGQVQEPDKLQIIEAFAQAGSREDAERLLACLEDPSIAVRAEAAAAALKIGGEEVLPRVAALVGQQSADEVRLRVIEGILALGGTLSKGATKVLIGAVEDKNDEVRLKAVSALARDGVRDPDAYKALGSALGDSVREIARTAAVRLNSVAQRDDVLLIPPDGLERGAGLPDEAQRLWVSDIALRFMAKGGRLTVKTLVRFMLDERPQIRDIENYFSGPGVRSWADELIRQSGEYGLGPADVAAIQSLTLAEKPHVRHNGYLALKSAPGAPGAGAQLVRALADADEEIRKKAVDWLAPKDQEDRLDVEAAFRMLQLEAAQPELVSPGIEAVLARLSAERRGALFAPLLRHKDAATRGRAARKVAKLPGAPAVDLSGDGSAAAEPLAAWWWAQRHPGKSVEQLVRELVDKNPTTRWRAAGEAAELATPAIRNALVGSLPDEQLQWVLEAKLAALVAVTGEKHGFAPGLPLEELRACARRFQTWLTRKIGEELHGRTR